MDERSPFRQQRWISCQNTGSAQIGEFGVMEHVGLTVNDDGEEVIQVRQVTEDAAENTCFNGPKSMGAGDFGICTFEAPFVAQYLQPVNSGVFHGQIYGPHINNFTVSTHVVENGFALIADLDSVKKLGLFDYARTIRPGLTVKLTGSTDGTGAYSRLTRGTQDYFVGYDYQGFMVPYTNGIAVYEPGVYRVSLSTAFAYSSGTEGDIPASVGHIAATSRGSQFPNGGMETLRDGRYGITISSVETLVFANASRSRPLEVVPNIGSDVFSYDVDAWLTVWGT